MDRMATNTRQPDVLRELFEALDNDPFVIAECLARPALVNRLITNWYAFDQRIHGALKHRAETELKAQPNIGQKLQPTAVFSDICLRKTMGSHHAHDRAVGLELELPDKEWDNTIAKLGAVFSGAPVAAANGSPTLPMKQIKKGTWSPLQEDETGYHATAVVEQADDKVKLTTLSWKKEPLESWLMRNEHGPPRTINAAYVSYSIPTIPDGATCIDDTWTGIAGPPDGRTGQTAVWTGSEMIIWGGVVYLGYLNTGARYVPSTDTWTATTDVDAPTGRTGHTAVWTGTEMIIWGGQDDFSGPPGQGVNTGGRYNPVTNSWTPTNTINAPMGRLSHTAVWTGSEMIVWGGESFNGMLNTGGRYDPGTDSWSATSTTNAPDARAGHTAVWTGNEMIVWGGWDFNNYFATGRRYNASTNSWTATSMTSAPSERALHTAVWTGSEMIIWGGHYYDGNDHYLNTGGRYNPSTDSWIPTGTAGAPAGRSSHTAVWTGSEMIVWGGYDGTYTNTGGRYNPTTNSWAATSTTNAPDARDGGTAVWTGSEMIIWGGHYYDGNDHYLNTGGRYNPSTDSWIPTGTTDVPAGRSSHTAVWTGSEMIVWGGYDGTYANTGGRYNPSTNSWAATSTTNAPDARDGGTAVWTGSEMIVWGGHYYDGNDHYLNTGGRYNPSTDSWIPTGTANAPVGRYRHVGIWTGTEMIIWGGFFFDGSYHYLDTGGRYD